MDEKKSHLYDDLARNALSDYRAALANEISFIENPDEKAELLTMIRDFWDDISERVLNILNPTGTLGDDVSAEEAIYSYESLKSAIQKARDGKDLQ